MKKMRRYIAVWVALAAAIAAILFLGDGEKEKAYRVASGVVWHTVYNVTYESGRDLGDSIVAVTSAIDRSASMYNRQSVLSRINAGVTDQADATVARLLLRSQEISGETGGAFDPTVAPLMRLWKTQTDSAALPTKADIDSVMQFVGMGKTVVPCVMNLFSIWAVRLTLAAWLAPTMGLKGVWLAMCIELCFRGVIFLLRLGWVFRKKPSAV